MCSKQISTELPREVISKLEDLGAHVRRECKDVPIIELVTSQSEEEFLRFLASDEEVDPIINVAFGHPVNPYISQVAQLEVFGIINSYQSLLPGVPLVWNPPPGGIPPPLGWQFHHAQISLQMVQAEIESPGRLAANCPLLLLIPPGNVVCSFGIVYANCGVTRMLRKQQ